MKKEWCMTVFCINLLIKVYKTIISGRGVILSGFNISCVICGWVLYLVLLAWMNYIMCIHLQMQVCYQMAFGLVDIKCLSPSIMFEFKIPFKINVNGMCNKKKNASVYVYTCLCVYHHVHVFFF